MTDFQSRITQLVSSTYQEPPEPTPEYIHAQMGSHIGNIAAMMAVLRDASATDLVRQELTLATDVLNHIQKNFRACHKESRILLDHLDSSDFKDSLDRQLATASFFTSRRNNTFGKKFNRA